VKLSRTSFGFLGLSVFLVFGLLTFCLVCFGSFGCFVSFAGLVFSVALDAAVFDFLACADLRTTFLATAFFLAAGDFFAAFDLAGDFFAALGLIAGDFFVAGLSATGGFFCDGGGGGGVDHLASPSRQSAIRFRAGK